MIHSLPVKNCGSSFDRCSGSGAGGYFDPSPTMYMGTPLIEVRPGSLLRTSISATPGIMAGGRIVTIS